MPLEEELLPHKLSNVILHMKDMPWAHVNVQQSPIILNQAPHCSRSKNRLKEEKGYCLFEEVKRELNKGKEFEEALAGSSHTSIPVTIL